MRRPSIATRDRAIVAVLGVIAGVLLLAACGWGDDDDAAVDGAGPDAQVLPFDTVQASDFVFEGDPTNLERGIFRVTTTEPMICAIVWGPTEALGNFNNSLAMNGTGIVQHDVYLPGARPGTTYHFLVQGTTADGTLYRSDLGTFTIPEPDVSPASTPGERGVDLALGGTVADVSSEFGPGFEAENAIDGSGTTEWSSAGDGDDAFITIDLGAPRAIGGVELVTRSMADGSAIIETYTVTIDDGEPLGPFPAATPAAPDVAALDAEGRLVRFDVETSTGGNVGAVEVRVVAP